MKRYKFILTALLAVTAACSKQEVDPEDQVTETDLTSVLVPSYRLPLYADLSQYTGEPSIETRSADKPVSLHSLLDNSKKTKMYFDGVKFTQIPFKKSAAEYPAYYGDDPDTPFEETVVTKKFYVKAEDEFVVTMVTGHRYASTNPQFDYLSKPNYTGAIFFSKLDGTLLKIQTYRSGLIQEAKVMTPEEAGENNLEPHYVKVASAAPSTRATSEYIYGWDGEAAVCIADRTSWTMTIDDTDEVAWPSGDMFDGKFDNTGGGGGGKTNEVKYTVSLYSSRPDDVGMIGSGSYPLGTLVNISSYRKNHVSSARCEFKRWTGSFAGKTTDSFLHKVTGNVSATAYYDSDGPCMDAVKGISNPIEGTMSIAATESGSYANGLFKANRGVDTVTGEYRYHWGIDIAAEPGTPLYAIYSGTIVSVYGGAKNKYEESSFGNYVIIESVINGKKTYFQYSHLQYGTPIAVNPGTGKPYKEGDTVNAGDQFGFTGRTGNAFNVPNKHLDLMVSYQFSSSTGKLVYHSEIDPVPFLNATIDASSLKGDPFNGNKAQMKNKKCN